MRLLALLVILLSVPSVAPAQTAAEAQLSLRIQQLEEQIRFLTGENERLAYELNQLRGGLTAAPDQTGAVTAQPLPPAQPALDSALAGQPTDLGSVSIDQNDPLISPDGDPLLIPAPAGIGGPIDLSVLAGGAPVMPSDPGGGFPAALDPNAGLGVPVEPDLPGETQTAALPQAPAPTASLSGSARDEYDLAYGYILTGDYGLAEESFRNWLAAFPSDAQAADAQFWLGESLYQQGEYREAANAFLTVYNGGAPTPKGPDALLKLGMSLAALGEQGAACATFGEVSRRYPDASAALTSRVNEEAGRAGC